MAVSKFPRTAHLFDAGGSAVSKDDLVLDDPASSIWLDGKTVVAVEEKVDGANLGVSIDPETSVFRFQNRSHFVNSVTHAQFRQLDRWASEHSADLHAILEPGRHILFGEWMAIKHSIHYTKLPGLFIAFDIFDKKKGKFMSRRRRDARLAATSIPVIKCIKLQALGSQQDLLDLLETPSAYVQQPGEGGFAGAEAMRPVEGIVLRIDEQEPAGEEGGNGDGAGAGQAALADEPTASAAAAAGGAPALPAGAGRDEAAAEDGVVWGRWLRQRCKVVRPDFVQGIDDHWAKGGLVKNIVVRE